MQRSLLFESLVAGLHLMHQFDLLFVLFKLQMRKESALIEPYFLSLLVNIAISKSFILL